MYIGTKKRGLYIVKKNDFELLCDEYFTMVDKYNDVVFRLKSLTGEFTNALDQLKTHGCEIWRSLKIFAENYVAKKGDPDYNYAYLGVAFDGGCRFRNREE